MMNTRDVLIKYKIHQIFECMDDNILLPPELKEYCSHDYKKPRPILEDLKKSMEEITDSYFNGVNPNDISFKTTIRDNLNKINNNNYNNILEELKTLDYSSHNHFMILVSDLILKSMNDVCAVKGMDNKESSNKTPSEIYMSVAREFVGLCIKDTENNIDIKFRDV